MNNLAAFLSAICLVCSTGAAIAQGTMRDREGNNYKTMVFSGKTWMAENLSVSHYRNGDAIPEAKSSADWDRYCENRTGCWCYYEFNPANGRLYGKLYNWFAVNDKRKLAPKGWHVPEDEEWLLFTKIPGRGNRSGIGMKSKFGWGSEQDECCGSNDTGFDGLPGGTRGVDEFFGISILGQWWCSTESEVDFARIRSLACNSDDLWPNVSLKLCGNSVRCVKD